MKRKRMLWKDIHKCLSKSKGRFLSIVCLVALGSFALVGLQISGPDMRKTGRHFFDQLKTADLYVIGDYGIDATNEKTINQIKGADTISYGYLKDVVEKDSHKSFRIFSSSEGISEYQMVSGRMPTKDDEIALAGFLSETYKIGDLIRFDEKADIAGNKILKHDSFKITGFVNSGELISIINMGQSSAGTGELYAYAVVSPKAFDSKVYMIARLSFKDTRGIDPYSPKYRTLIAAHKDALNKLLADQPAARLNAVKAEYQQKIDDAKADINKAKQKLSDAREKLQKGDQDLAAAKEKYTSGLSQYQSKSRELDQKVKEAEAKMQEAQSAFKQQAEAAEKAQAALAKAQQQEQAAEEAELAQNHLQLDSIPPASGTKEDAAAKAKAEAEAVIASQKQAMAQQQAALEAAKVKLASAKDELDKAQKQIADKEKELKEGWDKYHKDKPDADKKISDGEQKVSDAQDTLNKLIAPVYSVDTRRELPGSEGYRIFSSVADIVDSLADIFPIFLYFVAALVTLTTMTRFVDEERINAGTLKALGYNKRDILKKFTVYGFASGMTGAVVGIALGHTLLPWIVYKAYGKFFTIPPIELHFYPRISLTALLLAFMCAVVPAFVVAGNELREKPAALLLPKPPENGSKIMLEHITPLWRHMSFTQKVTARNIFRYKKRMLMTIFGVCGAVTLIFAGFSVQHSISGIKERQFEQLMNFDLIAAQTHGINDDERASVQKLLKEDSIRNQMPIHYEKVTKSAGRNGDKQDINLIVPDKASDLSTYICLVNRKSGRPLSLDDKGCIISERLSRLLHLKPGDSLTFNDEDDHERTVVVSGITEMYTGHYIFMDRAAYEKAFGTTYAPNAYMMTLKDRTLDNANREAARFMALDGIKGVVQNSTLINEIDTIVHALNMIMEVLIIVANLLAVVILYNLTNINVCERIRELSTIKVLGFYNKEVTMYIYRETILLTLLGILAGFGFGDALYLYIINIVPPDNVMFDPALGPAAFLIPVFVVAGITFLLGLIMNRKLKNLDMLEALKSID